jgi:hypothetical protein
VAEVELSGLILVSRLSSEFPGSNPRLKEFPSGSFMIDLVVSGENYVIEYVVGKGYGLSKQSGAVFGWEGVDEEFETLSELELGVRKLMTTPG